MNDRESFQRSGSSRADEVDRLNTYLARWAVDRSFRKVDREHHHDRQAKASTRSKQWGLAPYRYLQTDLILLLGPSGGQLLNRIWSQHDLPLKEEDPDLIRPVLVKLFARAARLAASKDLGPNLTRLVRDFEKIYFPVMVDSPNSLGASSGCPVAREHERLKNAYQTRSWNRVYVHVRLLKRQTDGPYLYGTQLDQVFDKIAGNGCSESKKKQLLTDLADCSDLDRGVRVSHILEALGYPQPSCRPGESEGLACELLPPSDPLWRASLGRLYRHRPVATRWHDDLATLHDCEPSLRSLYILITEILQRPNNAATVALAQNNDQLTPADVSPAELKRSMAKVKRVADQWAPLLPSEPPPLPYQSTAVALKPGSRQFIDRVSEVLGSSPPEQTQTRFQSRPVEVVVAEGERTLLLAPEFFSCHPREQHFFLARALFREATGLNRLEARTAALATPSKIYQRAIDHAQNHDHRTEYLRDFIDGRCTVANVGVTLEELYWDTSDPVYKQLSHCLQYRGHYPLCEQEADLFAYSFTDLVTASHAIVSENLWGKQLRQVCSREGLSVLTKVGKDCPELALRLQSLWFGVADHLQQQLLS